MFETLEVLRTPSGPVGVDHDKKIIYGVIVCELGEFRTPGRGRFDAESLAAVAKLINAQPDGIVVNYGHHENAGSPDAMDAFLGRAKNARVDRNRVLADLHFNPVAFMSHTGGTSRGERLLERAESDPRAIALSMTLQADKLPVRGGGSPIWRPIEISSVDLVATGDATPSGLLPMSAVPARVLFARETPLAEALSFICRRS